MNRLGTSKRPCWRCKGVKSVSVYRQLDGTQSCRCHRCKAQWNPKFQMTYTPPTRKHGFSAITEEQLQLI